MPNAADSILKYPASQTFLFVRMHHVSRWRIKKYVDAPLDRLHKDRKMFCISALAGTCTLSHVHQFRDTNFIY
jgi:hypothetical protein